MFLEMTDSANAGPATECPIRRELALLAASLDTRFLRAGNTLGAAIEMIDRVIGGLDGIVAALDEKTAGAAVSDLRRVADELTLLPTRQADRGERMAAVATIAKTLNDHVLDMNQTLRVLIIYGMNIKIAASGTEQFVGFVDGMKARLSVGEQELAGFIAQLKTLMVSVASVQQADRLLAAESSRVVPEIPARLASDAGELSDHLAGVATLARKVAGIARSVQGKVAVVLGALQVGDSTRQRLEHVVSTLQMVEAHFADRPADIAVQSHIYRLLAAQMDAIGVDFARETRAMLASLAELAPDSRHLLQLIEDQDSGGGRTFLTRLEQGITDVGRVTARLRDAEGRSRTMVGIIAGTVAELSTRLVSVERICVNVQDIATNTRLLCRRYGSIGKAVSVIATEVDAYASRLGKTTANVATAIGDLGHIEATLRDGDAVDGERDMGETLAAALSVVRQACQCTERVTMDGGDDARFLVEMLATIGDELRDELAVVEVMQAAGATLSSLSPAVPITDEAAASLHDLLPRIAALYTMAQERVVHAGFLLPGMQPAVAAATEEEDDDDGLF